jgi:SOS-response transcriptional repressor LexA
MERIKKKYTKKILVNPEMVAKRGDFTEEEAKGLEMTPVQKEVFLYIDEYWKKYGWGPTYREIAAFRKKGSLGNVHMTIRRLIRLGVLKQVKGMERSVRPVYINFRNLE